MAIVVQVTLTDDKTGEVKQVFAEAYGGRDSWDEAHAIHRLLARVFKAEFGPSNDDWPNV